MATFPSPRLPSPPTFWSWLPWASAGLSSRELLISVLAFLLKVGAETAWPQEIPPEPVQPPGAGPSCPEVLPAALAMQLTDAGAIQAVLPNPQ